jgi:hypothetical protein
MPLVFPAPNSRVALSSLDSIDTVPNAPCAEHPAGSCKAPPHVSTLTSVGPVTSKLAVASGLGALLTPWIARIGPGDNPPTLRFTGSLPGRQPKSGWCLMSP